MAGYVSWFTRLEGSSAGVGTAQFTGLSQQIALASGDVYYPNHTSDLTINYRNWGTSLYSVPSHYYWIAQSASYFNALMSHRNGPYGWPSWKQIRVSENPLSRKQKANSIFTYVEEPGNVYSTQINGKNYNHIDRFGGIKAFSEPMVTVAFKPLNLIVSVEPPESLQAVGVQSGRASIKTTLGNDTAFFANDEINRYYQTIEESDESYEDLKELYLNGALDEDSSPIDEFKMLIYTQTIWPKPENTFLARNRGRQHFVNKFWKNKRIDRSKKDVVSFGTSIADQSMWPLDVPEDWATRPMPTFASPGVLNAYVGGAGQTGDPGKGSLGAPGILMNGYCCFSNTVWFNQSTLTPANPGTTNQIWSGEEFDRYYSASCVYAYKHTLNSIRSAESKVSHNNYLGGYNLLTNALAAGNNLLGQTADIQGLAGDDYRFINELMFSCGEASWDVPAQSGKTPFYNSYSDYAQKIRLKGQGYSIVPEFRISSHVKTYILKGVTDELKPIFELSGALSENTTTADTDQFYEIYNNSDFLKHFELIKKDHEEFTSPAAITLKCQAIKKFLPYEGFYPVQRAVQLAEQFYNSYSDYIQASASVSSGGTQYSIENPFRPTAAAQFIMEPLFAPGVLFNTIKAGVACDFPVLSADQLPQSIYTDHQGRNDNWVGNPRTWFTATKFADLYGSIDPKPQATNEAWNTLWFCNYEDAPFPVAPWSLYGNSKGPAYTPNGINLNGMYDRRIPFEALLEPERWLSNINLASQQPGGRAIGKPDTFSVYGNWEGTGTLFIKNLQIIFWQKSLNFSCKDKIFPQ